MDPSETVYYTTWLLLHDDTFRTAHKAVSARAFPKGCLQYLVSLELRLGRSLQLPVVRAMVESDGANLRRHGAEADLVVSVYEDLTEGYAVEAEALPTMREVCGRWLGQRSLKVGIDEAISSLESGDFDRARSVLAAAQYSTTEEDEPLDLRSNADYILAGSRFVWQDAVPTGLRDLDSAWKGGLRPGEVGIVMGFTGLGKCHAKGQGILLYDGTIKLVEDILPGDQLMGPDSHPRSVLALGRGREEMRQIIPTKGSPFTVTASHILTLVNTRDGDVVDVSVTEWEGWNAGRKHLYKLFRRPVVSWKNPSNLPLPPRLLGMWLGGGGCGKGGRYARFTTIDPEIVEYLETWGSTVGLRLVPVKPISYSMSGRMGSPNYLWDSLRRLGLWKRTSGDKFIPQSYKTASVHVRQELLAGLMDTDGSLTGGCFDYSSKSKQLAEDVVFVARSLGLAAYLSSAEKRDQYGRGGIYYRVCISGDINQIPCILKSKQAPLRRQKKNVLRTGFQVRALPEDEYYGFVLDGDRRYLLDDFTVTHNTMWLCMFAARAFWAGRSVLYYSTELTKEQIQTRIALGILEAGLNDLPKEVAFEDQLIQAARNQGYEIGPRSNVRVRYAEGTISSLDGDLVAYKEEFGYFPGLLIIDSPIDLPPPGKFEKGYEGLRASYILLRQLARKYGVPIWTSVQTNREAVGKAKSRLKDIGDAYAMAQKSHYVLGLTQTLEQAEEGQNEEHRGALSRSMMVYILKDSLHGQTGGMLVVHPHFGEGDDGYPGVEVEQTYNLHLPVRRAD